MYIETEPQLGELYAAYAPSIIGYLTRLTGSTETAEDLTHDTFVKALLHSGQLESIGCVRAWLFRIATNTAYDELRRGARRPTAPLTGRYAESLLLAGVGLPLEERVLLWAVLDTLPERYRVPLLLQAYAGYPVEAVAALLGWKVGTVKSRIHRARTHVQKHYAASSHERALGGGSAVSQERGA